MTRSAAHPNSLSGAGSNRFARSLTYRLSIVSTLAVAIAAGVIAITLMAMERAKVERHGAYITRTFSATSTEVIRSLTDATASTLQQLSRAVEQSDDLPNRLQAIAGKYVASGEKSFRVGLHDHSGRFIDWIIGPVGVPPPIDLQSAASPFLQQRTWGGLFYQLNPTTLRHETKILAGVAVGSDKWLVGILDIEAVARHIESIYEGRIMISNGAGELIFGDLNLPSGVIRTQLLQTNSYRVFDSAGRLYESISSPIHDLTGRSIGTLHLVKQDDGSIATERLLERLATIVFALALALFIAALLALFRAELRPLADLERLVDDLSHNDLHTPAIDVARMDEVGRLNESVETLRGAAIERDRLAFSSSAAFSLERSLIESELRKLSEMLSSEERQEVADLLAQVQADAARHQGIDQSPADRSLARAFRLMSERVRAQQERLTRLLAERTADLEIVKQSLAERSDLFRLREEMSVARSLQLSMLPDPESLAAVHRQIDLQATTRPAKEVGGDSFDFQLLEAGRRLIFLVCDSSGKGVPAAMFVLTSRALAVAASAAIGRLDIGLQVANSTLARTNDALAFTTMFIGSLDLTTGLLTYSNAGHNPPVLLRADGTRQRLDQAVGLVMGVMDDARYEASQVQLYSDDTLILYTDGVTEAHDASGNMFGLDRFESACSAVRLEAPTTMIDRLIAQVDAFAGDTPQYDDITLMALRYTPEASGTG